MLKRSLYVDQISYHVIPAFLTSDLHHAVFRLEILYYSLMGPAVWVEMFSDEHSRWLTRANNVSCLAGTLEPPS